MYAHGLSGRDSDEFDGTESNDQESSGYLKKWIDTILAHIMVTVEDIHITLVGIDELNPAVSATFACEHVHFPQF